MKESWSHLSRQLERRARIAFAAALVAVVFSAGAGVGADDQSVPPTAFFAPLQVPLVSLDVIAVDKDGQPVPGLGPGDFEVLEDGRPVEISHFQGLASSATGAPGDDGASPAALASDLYLAVFLDDSEMAARWRRSALEHLRGLLEGPLPPATRTMLVRYAGQLEMVSEFSDSPEALLPLLDEISRQDPLASYNEVQVLVREMQNGAAVSEEHQVAAAAGRSNFGTGPASMMRMQMGDSFLPQIHSLARVMFARNQGSLQALTDYVRFLSAVPGRKVLLWIGDGIETRVGQSLFAVWERLFPGQARELAFNPAVEAQAYDSSGQVRGLAELASSHRVSLYTLSPRRAALTGQVSAEDRSVITSSRLEGADAVTDDDALTYLSELTGGRNLVDGRTLDRQLGQVVQELGSYYSLGYTPPSAGDGAYHHITVRTQRDGVVLRHRQGYQDGDRGDAPDARALAAAMLGVADNPLGIVLELQPQEAREDGVFLVPVLVRIPIGKLVLVPEGDHHTAQISMSTAVRDDPDRLPTVHDRRYPIEIPNAQLLQAMEQQARFLVGIVMREGEHRIAVAIRDDRSLVEATSFVDVTVSADRQDQDQ